MKYKPQLNSKFKREDLASLFHLSGYKTGAEIGVHKGKHASELCEAIPGLKLYCIDIWEAFPCGIARFESQRKQDSYYKQARETLSKYDVVLIRKASVAAAEDFEDNSLDFIYIDGNHSYDFVMQDLISWNRVVRSGGMISGHDYDPDWGVKKAVDDFVQEHDIDNCFYSKEHSPSFWWVKK